jgi:NAD(P)-dependent dehydrogenase (short-subunit alcohol dehydrogenase family)
MDLSLRDRVVVVTGAGGAIGAAIAAAFLAEGAAVVVSDLDVAAATRVAERLSGEPGGDQQGAVATQLDVSSEASWQDLIELVRARFGRLDILVNNAGINSELDAVSETVEGFARVVAVNEIGVWLGMKACIPLMREADRGSIVNIASISGVVAGFGRAIAYHATKASVRGMTRNSALRFAADGIRINSVHPGPVNTPMQDKDRGSPIEQENLDLLMIKRFAEPEEVASVVLFVASDRASFDRGRGFRRRRLHRSLREAAVRDDPGGSGMSSGCR